MTVTDSTQTLPAFANFGHKMSQSKSALRWIWKFSLIWSGWSRCIYSCTVVIWRVIWCPIFTLIAMWVAGWQHRSNLPSYRMGLVTNELSFVTLFYTLPTNWKANSFFRCCRFGDHKIHITFCRQICEPVLDLVHVVDVDQSISPTDWLSLLVIAFSRFDDIRRAEPTLARRLGATWKELDSYSFDWNS